MRPSKKARLAALECPGDVPAHFLEQGQFPAPDLSKNPDQDFDPQPFSEFFSFEERAHVLPTRRTIYLVPVGYTLDALAPRHTGVSLPSPATIAGFLGSYTGLPTKVLPELPLVPWKNTSKASATAPMAVRTSTCLVKVRTQKDPLGEFRSSLHCHDILDALMEELPKDAFCIMGLTAYDIHEDGTCVGGRAFGGSRIAVVSLARYHPNFEDVAPEWPAGVKSGGGAPLQAALSATSAIPPPTTPTQLTALWLGRVAATAMHELGHCLGLDHCTLYSCLMGENEGQATYCCPVCLRKLLCAVGGDKEGSPGGGAAAGVGGGHTCTQLAPAMAHYARLGSFCRDPGNGGGAAFAALGAWCIARVVALTPEA